MTDRVLYTSQDVQAAAHLAAINQLVDSAMMQLTKAMQMSSQLSPLVANATERAEVGMVSVNLYDAKSALRNAHQELTSLTTAVLGRPVQVAEIMALLDGN